MKVRSLSGASGERLGIGSHVNEALRTDSRPTQDCEDWNRSHHRGNIINGIKKLSIRQRRGISSLHHLRGYLTGAHILV